MWHPEIASILPFHWDFSHELHEEPSFSSTVHEEVDDLVDDVLLLEHDEVLLAATRSFHTIFVNFFGHSHPGIRAFESPLDSQRGIAPFVGPGESYLFAFRVLSLNFVTLRMTCVTANNGFLRSIMTRWRRRQTGRQAFSFRVIGSSSARVEERLTDGKVIVVEVFREPLLGHGLLGELGISLRDEVVVELITCGGVLFVRWTQLLSRSARGCSPRHQGSRRWKAVGSEGR